MVNTEKINDFQDLPLPDLLLGNCKQKKRKNDINSFAFVTHTFRKGYINRRNPNKCEKKNKNKKREGIYIYKNILDGIEFQRGRRACCLDNMNSESISI